MGRMGSLLSRLIAEMVATARAELWSRVNAYGISRWEGECLNWVKGNSDSKQK